MYSEAIAQIPSESENHFIYVVILTSHRIDKVKTFEWGLYVLMSYWSMYVEIESNDRQGLPTSVYSQLLLMI